MTDASNHLPDTADQDVTEQDATEELAAPEFIDAPENLPGDHAEPTNV